MEQRPNSQEIDDAAILKKMGYEQELHRHMSAFSNFALSPKGRQAFCRLSI